MQSKNNNYIMFKASLNKQDTGFFSSSGANLRLSKKKKKVESMLACAPQELAPCSTYNSTAQ